MSSHVFNLNGVDVTLIFDKILRWMLCEAGHSAGSWRCC